MIWQELPGHQGRYLVSECGKIKRMPFYKKSKNGSLAFASERIIKSRLDKDGYEKISIWTETGRLNTFAHRLVALSFLPNPDRKPMVNHKDSNRANNHFSNLEWVTSKENCHHGILYGNDARIGSLNKNSKLNENPVKGIKTLLSKRCYTCSFISKMYGISESVIRHIKKNRNWCHVSI